MIYKAINRIMVVSRLLPPFRLITLKLKRCTLLKWGISDQQKRQKEQPRSITLFFFAFCHIYSAILCLLLLFSLCPCMLACTYRSNRRNVAKWLILLLSLISRRADKLISYSELSSLTSENVSRDVRDELPHFLL